MKDLYVAALNEGQNISDRWMSILLGDLQLLQQWH
jgi:hypothetical protein